MYKRFLVMSMLSFLMLSCQANLNSQYRDLPDSHLVFPFKEDKFQYINGINWAYQNQLAVQGIIPQAGRWPIYIADVEERSLIQIAYHDHPVSAYNPAISPNGKYLAFLPDSADHEYGVKIFKLGEVIDNNFVLPDNPISVNVKPHVRLAWSPDSSQLAMLGFESDNVLALYVYTVSKDSLETIAEYSEKNIDKDTTLHIGRIEYSMSWSSDGEKLAFSLEYEAKNQRQSDLFVYHFKQNRFIRLTSTPKISERYPSWYPKDDILVFVLAPNSDLGIARGKLVFTTRDGSCTKTLPKLEGIDSPSWSPDGMQIAYLSEDGLEVMDVARVIPQEFLSAKKLCSQGN